MQFYGLVYLSVGPEAKRDIYYNFDLDKCLSFKLDPPSKEKPLLVKISQEGKDPIHTTDFCVTNVKPADLVIPPVPEKDTPEGDQAAAVLEC